MRRPNPIRPAQTRPLKTTGLDNFTVYSPPVQQRRSFFKPIDIVCIIVGATSIMFGIHPFFSLIVTIGQWLQ